jgi:hypothetical protein
MNDRNSAHHDDLLEDADVIVVVLRVHLFSHDWQENLTRSHARRRSVP